MRRVTTEKIVVLALSFLIFIGGVLALLQDRGPVRTGTLALVFAALLAIAVRQSLKRRKKK